MPVAAFLPAIITAGGAVGGAYLASRGAQKAAETQAEAGDRALDVQERMYQQDRADWAPYQHVGTQSIGALGHLMGLPAYAPPPQDMLNRDPTGTNHLAQSEWEGHPRGMPRIPASMMDTYEQASLARYGSGTPNVDPSRVPMLSQGNHPDSVRMQAPDGEVGEVPWNDVERLERGHGFRRVS